MNFPNAKKAIDLGKYPDKIKPNFFIIGAARSGTTSLYNYLSQSPEIFMSFVKEPHFFANVAIDDPKLKKRPKRQKKYHTIFFENEEAYLSLFDEAVGHKAIGEASPSYLYDEETPHLIKKNIPDAKLIAVLRDPIERAFSHYLLDVSNGKQSLGFYDALVEDYAKEEKGWGISHLYVELGFYYMQLKRYFDVFDSSQLLILPFDLIKNDPLVALQKAARFLGVNDQFIATIDVQRAFNIFRVPKGRLSKLLFQYRFRFTKVLDIIPDKFKSSLRNIFFLKKAKKPSIDQRAIKFLSSIYESNLLKLRDLLGEEFYFQKNKFE